MYPRFLIAFDESVESLPVTVRVGQAVDVVGQAGRPKTITGFQTHSTPVLLAHSERAELATEECKFLCNYISLCCACFTNLLIFHYRHTFGTCFGGYCTFTKES